MKKAYLAMTVVLVGGLAFACSRGGGSSGDEGKAAAVDERGVGPVSSVEVGPLDMARAVEGEKIFKSKCTMCHKIEERYVGPALLGVTKRQKPEWIMNMILNPVEMTQKDPTAKELLGTYYTQMTNQNVTQDQARSILEYFRKKDASMKKDDPSSK